MSREPTRSVRANGFADRPIAKYGRLWQCKIDALWTQA